MTKWEKNETKHKNHALSLQTEKNAQCPTENTVNEMTENEKYTTSKE